MATTNTDFHHSQKILEWTVAEPTTGTDGYFWKLQTLINRFLPLLFSFFGGLILRYLLNGEENARKFSALSPLESRLEEWVWRKFSSIARRVTWFPIFAILITECFWPHLNRTVLSEAKFLQEPQIQKYSDKFSPTAISHMEERISIPRLQYLHTSFFFSRKMTKRLLLKNLLISMKSMKNLCHFQLKVFNSFKVKMQTGNLKKELRSFDREMAKPDVLAITVETFEVLITISHEIKRTEHISLSLQYWQLPMTFCVIFKVFFFPQGDRLSILQVPGFLFSWKIPGCNF